MSLARLPLVLAATLLAAVSAGQPAPTRAPADAPPALSADTPPVLSADTPLQCWWRASPGAIHVGEIVEVTLTCAVLETSAVRAVPDESRLSVASVQLMPFEIVGGSHPPDVRAGDRRLFQYAYQLRLLDADVIGRDVKLPPLAIPYRVQSQTGADATLAGRDLAHLMPQLVIRVVSQVPVEADDIRDSADASLARIDALRFRANAFSVGAMVLGALAAVAGLGALAPVVGRLRKGRTKAAGRVSDRLVLGHAAVELDRLAKEAAGAGWTPESLTGAHGAVRLAAAALVGDGVRQLRLGPDAPVPEGRLLLRRRLRARTALTAHITGDAVGRAIAALPPGAPAADRERLERMRESLDALTRAQYTQGATLDDGAPIDEAVTVARDIARQVARERLWAPREWLRIGHGLPAGAGFVMSVESLWALGQSLVTDWRALAAGGVQFAYRDDPGLAAVGLAGLALVVLAVRLSFGTRPAKDAVAVPALFGAVRGSRLAWTRHLPLALAGLGLPLAILALADPFTALVSSTVTYPGRRIALMIDASDSMRTSFKAETLNTRSATEPAFFTTVAAARRFVELRRAGKYTDLMALVEFGDRAYVITPFTSDYDNLLLSIALIGDPIEFSMFPDPGTVIASAIEQSIEIFKAFKFLEASGNLMVIFTDGEDTTSIVHGRSLDDILKSAVDNGIPLYFVRTNYGKAFGDGIPDATWQAAVEKTGGRYYVARDEQSLLAAVGDIDRAAVGAIEVRQDTSRQPRFAVLALGAAGCFLLAAVLRLAVPQFSTFP